MVTQNARGSPIVQRLWELGADFLARRLTTSRFVHNKHSFGMTLELKKTCLLHYPHSFQFSVQWQKPKSLQGRFQCDKTAKRNCTYVSAIYLFPTVKLLRKEVQLEKICLMLVLTRSLHAWHTFINISVDLTLTMLVHRIMQWSALWCDIVIICSNRTFSNPRYLCLPSCFSYSTWVDILSSNLNRKL